jgi:methylmalonyl-CoA/ethylmalonyl-CoA epimerase
MFNLDHLAIAVPDLDAAVGLYCQLLGFPAEQVEYHDVPSEGVRVALLKGNTAIELIQPTDPAGSVARFIEKRGPGLHHLCFATEDAQARLDELKAGGSRLLDDAPRTGAEGRVFFVHPASAGGVLTEFVEKPAD